MYTKLPRLLLSKSMSYMYSLLYSPTLCIYVKLMMYNKKRHQSFSSPSATWSLTDAFKMLLLERFNSSCSHGCALSKSVVSQAHTRAWSQGFLWCFFFGSPPSTTRFNFVSLPLNHHICPSTLISFFKIWLLIFDTYATILMFPSLIFCPNVVSLGSILSLWP